MSSLGNVPEWLGASAATGAVALRGFVGKSFWEADRAFRRERHARRATLVRLHSLLRASGVTFAVQNGLASRLLEMIRARRSTAQALDGGYERVFVESYEDMTPAERELHGIIRSMTVNALRPTNQALSDWLRRDTFYKSHEPDDRRWGRLAQLLAMLDAHLTLWHAKYKGWIPEAPAHALVYLADESDHGVGFPTGIDEEVARTLGWAATAAPLHDVA